MIMAEEFQESDVIFSDEYDSSSSSSGHNNYDINFNNQKSKKKQRKRQKSTGSVPIHIPKNVNICSDDSDEDDQDLPPHLIVAKRIEEGMAFSMKSGRCGRALKGRELSEFRNSILRMTGFLET